MPGGRPRAPGSGTGAQLYIAESASAYARRPLIVVDATVLAAALFGEAEQDQAAALLTGRALAAPHLVDYEMANVALKKIERERQPKSAVIELLQTYAALAIDRYAVDPTAMLMLAHTYGLTAYDAAYLWLAERLQAPLATFDALLAKGARAHLKDGDGE